MRRLGTLLAIAAIALAALAPAASAASGDRLADVTVGGLPDEKPTLTFAVPFTATKTARRVISKGAGDKLAKGSKIVFDYVLVDGRTGDELGASFGAQPVTTVLDASQATPGLVKSLVGTSVGSRVLIAVAPEDGFARAARQSGTPGVEDDDTLLLVVDVRSASTPLRRATGTRVAPVAGLPRVTLGKQGKPTITIPRGQPPADLVVQPLIDGAGPVVAAGQTLTVHYTGVVWRNGKQVDSSWSRRTPAYFRIGTGSVIPGWDQGLVGRRVGSQVLLVIPPALGYGERGNPNAGIRGTDTLVFVVDILDVT